MRKGFGYTVNIITSLGSYNSRRAKEDFQDNRSKSSLTPEAVSLQSVDNRSSNSKMEKSSNTDSSLTSNGVSLQSIIKKSIDSDNFEVTSKISKESNTSDILISEIKAITKSSRTIESPEYKPKNNDNVQVYNRKMDRHSERVKLMKEEIDSLKFENTMLSEELEGSLRREIRTLELVRKQLRSYVNLGNQVSQEVLNLSSIPEEVRQGESPQIRSNMRKSGKKIEEKIK